MSQNWKLFSIRHNLLYLSFQLIETVEGALSEMFRKKEVFFTVAETVYGGSFAKGTDIMAPDFDLVFRINNLTDPVKDFREIIAVVKGILEKNVQYLNILPVPIETTPYSLRFWFVNGIQVDLPIATAIKEPDQVLERIRKDVKDKSLARYYYTSLVEHQVRVIASQTEFTRKLIRLTKLWKSQCDFGNIRKLSTIFELIGMASGLEEHEKPEKQRSIVQALVRVFEMIESLDTLKIVFRKVDGVWKLLRPEALKPDALLPSSIVGLPEMLERQRLLVEPMNPYNDLLEDLDKRGIQKIVDYATIMKERLVQLLNRRKYQRISGGALTVQLEKLFEPMPLVIGGKFQIGLPSHVYLSQDRFQHRRRSSLGQLHRPSEFLDMKIRRHDIFADDAMKRVLLMVRARMLGAVTCAAGSLRNVSENTSEEVMKIVHDLLENMMPSPPVKITVAGDKKPGKVETLDAFDVTISMPYGSEVCDDDQFCYGIRVSLKWGK